MKLYSVCHKEFRDIAVERLTEGERNHVISYIVNERYPKAWGRFSNLVGQVREYELENYNPRYQLKKYFEYGTIAHIYLNKSLQDNYVGVLHSDIIFEQGSINEMLEECDKNPNTIFYNIFFGAELEPKTLHPLYLFPHEVKQFGVYMKERMGVDIDVSFVLNNGWIGAMCAAPLEVFTRFGEFMERYCEELEQILNTDVWGLQTWAGKHTICGIIERMWGFYLVSLGYPMKYMRILHEQQSYQHDH